MKGSLQAFAPVLSEPHQSTTAFKSAIVSRIQDLMAAGLGNKAVSINTYLRCLKAFLRWAHEEGILTKPIKLSWLKEEEKILAILTPEQIKRIVDWKPPRESATTNRLYLLRLRQLIPVEDFGIAQAPHSGY